MQLAHSAQHLLLFSFIPQYFSLPLLFARLQFELLSALYSASFKLSGFLN